MADDDPLEFVAVTVTRNVDPASPDWSAYEPLVAPLIIEQLAPLESQCFHWYAYEVGEPLQVPFDAVSVCPTVVVPVIAGAVEFVGADIGAGAVTAVVARDVATEEPYLFDAVTVTRSVYPTFAVTGMYVEVVMPASAKQLLPDESQRSH